MSFIYLQISQQWNLTGLTFAILPASTTVANIFGGLACGVLTDSYGRVWPYAISVLLVAIFVLASAFSPSFTVMVILRFLGAIGVGGLLAVVYPMFVEFLPVRNRGQAGVLLMLIQTVGSCVTVGLAWWLFSSYPHNGWRYLVIATSLLSFFIFIYRVLFFFQSPRFLISKGRLDEAWKVISRMAKFNCKDLDNHISKEQFIQSLLTDTTVFQNRPLCSQFIRVFDRKHFLDTICLMFVYSDIKIAYLGITMFLPTLLQHLNVDPYFGALVGFAAQMPGILLVVIIIEWPWFGRLNTFRLFMCGSAIFFFLFAFIQNQLTIPIFTVFLYFFLCPTISLVHTYTSELYPTEIRTLVLALVNASESIATIWVPFGSGYLADLAKLYPWLSPTVWGVVIIAGILASFGLQTETRGRNLQDIV